MEMDGSQLRISDLASANGTFVNDRPVTSEMITPADRIRIGRFELSWSFHDPERTSLINPDEMTSLRASGPTVLPARLVVAAAEAQHRRSGHELDGFLSVEHGFLPVDPPLVASPDSHHAWDTMIEQLPELFRRLSLRREFDRMPVLDATPQALPDRYLLRASTMLGVFAHAYQYMAIDPPGRLPESLLRPWTQVSRRLGKKTPAVSYIDLFFYNWRLRDPAGPRVLDNMDLLVPTWNNAAERYFYLVTAEFAMGLTPVLSAMLSAQEAVLADDPDGVRDALLIILDQLHHVTQSIYPQIDPNLRGRHATDQVLWAKTVGTAGVPILDGAPSPSGTAQPQFHAIDAFLERRNYSSLVGQQSVYLAGFFPRHWRELVEALRAVSVRQYVEDTRNPQLRGIYNAVLDAYAGDRGWMGLHRVKAYGFLEVSFKVGRQVTTGARFTGLFKDRTWDKVDTELAIVRDERRPPVGPPVVFGTARPGRVVTDPETGSWTCYAQIDVDGQGVHHRPGDRVGILAENDDELVRRTIVALQATGDELVRLTPFWRAAVACRSGYSDDVEVLPLRTLLQFARIRPLGRGSAKRLVHLSAVGALGRIVDARMEDQWELWDALNLLHAGGYDVTRLWKADPGDPDSLCAIVSPEPFRLYSIASSPSAGKAATTLSLIVRGLDYTTPRTPWSYVRERSGTASHFLRRVTIEGRGRMSLQIVATPRFHLPDDTNRPLVMFAAGSGIAPFRAFVAARTGTHQDRLYFGLRSSDEFVEHGDLDTAAAAGRLRLSVAFSRAERSVDFDGVHHVIRPGHRSRVTDLIRSDVEHLGQLLRPLREGGREAHVYVCGSAPFAASVMDELASIAAGAPGGGREFVRQLMADGRLQLDVFTTYLGHAQQGRHYDVSDLAVRNTPEAGHWMAVGGRVYDVGEFLHLHIGGPHIIRNHAGLDATVAYRKVLHHLHSEIDAQLGMYEIGHLRRLHFGARWGVVLTEEGLRSLPLEDLFTAWVRFVYLIVGMENALRADYGFVDTVATRGENPSELTPFKAQYVVESHRRFLISYLDGLVSDDLRPLWQLTTGFCDPALDIRTFDRDLLTQTSRPDHRLVRDSVSAVKDLLTAGTDHPRVINLCRAYMHADQDLLVRLKQVMLSGVRAFEEHEADVIDRAAQTLLAAAGQGLVVISDYYRSLADQTRRHGIIDPGTHTEEPVPPDRGLPGHGGPLALPLDRKAARPAECPY